MIIDDFDIVGMAVPPDETNPPLSIDADTVLTSAISLQSFQLIPRRDHQIFQSFGCMQIAQATPGDHLNILRQFPRKAQIKDFFGLSASECFDHI